MIYRSTRQPMQRRGVILMVVLILLTLFAIVGITFVFYSQAQATSSRFWRESDFDRFRAGQPPTPPKPVPGPVPQPGINDGAMTVRWALGQLIYDVPDDSSGINSSIRGHSLARTMWGFNDTTLNTQPYSGTGRWRIPNTLSGLDDYVLPNYTYHQADGFVRDPEHYGASGAAATSLRAANGPRLPFTGGLNVSYTYPDIHNMFVAAVRADGTVMLPSFYRPWLFNNGAPLTDRTIGGAANDWLNATGRYKILRPRPIDMGTDPVSGALLFPYPVDDGGDVKNKTGVNGSRMDSIWTDMDHPVMTNGDGRKYKPLFAWLVEPLDNRVDLNVHGNLLGLNGGNRGHASHQGWGRWEVNPAWVLNVDASMNANGYRNADGLEWTNLLKGMIIPNTPPAQPTVLAGRYGADTPTMPVSLAVPQGTGSTSSGNRTPRVFGQIDFNAFNESGMTPTSSTAYWLPGEAPGMPSNNFDSFPSYGPSYGNAAAAEQLEHPLLYDRFKPSGWLVYQNPVPPSITPTYVNQWDDNSFSSLLDLQHFVMTGLLNSGVSSTRFTQLCPLNFSDTSTLPPAQLTDNDRRRKMITTISMDLNRPAIGPWLYDRNTSGYGIPNNLVIPNGPTVAMPGLTNRGTVIPNGTLPNNLPSDFSNDWRSVIATLERVDLNRQLRPYPHRQQTMTGIVLQHNLRHDTLDSMGNAVLDPAADAALKDRQQLAQDIYDRLVAVTGAPKPTAADVGMQQVIDEKLATLRWLGQLAVNIVDYIDDDEISTPFNFFDTRDGASNLAASHSNPDTKEELPTYWVFGTELPAVVLNEVMVEYQLPRDMAGKPETGRYQVRVFAELHNPLPTTGPNSVQLQDANAVPLYIPAAGAMLPEFDPYRIVVGNTADVTMGGPLYPRAAPTNDNVVGAVQKARAKSQFKSSTTRTVDNAMSTSAVAVGPQKYFLVGPEFEDYNKTLARNAGTPIYHDNMTMQYPVDLTVDAMGTETHSVDDRTTGLTVTLRRLANPHLPENTTILVNGVPNPLYNPYITVDYIEVKEVNEQKPNNNSWASRGKSQPYTSDVSQVALQKSPATGMPDAIQHTFGLANNPTALTGKNTWLQHLDRILISPFELLNVSGYRPHELTHQFVTSAGPHRHRVPWFDEDLSDPTNPTTMPGNSHRLWRFFELIETANMATGVSRLGRDPGRININMLWEPEVLLALCDPQSANVFSAAKIHNPNWAPPPMQPWTPQVILDPMNSAPLYWKLLASRSPDWFTLGTPGPNDRPFTGLGVGDDGQTNINNTLLRSQTPLGNGTTARLFDTGDSSHYDRQFQLLNKIFNNVTTRSNTFAVWLTVGFFDVTDETTRPIKLGAECTTGGVKVRHQFFCIVDRTQLTLDLKKIDPSTGTRNPAPNGPIEVFTCQPLPDRPSPPQDPYVRTYVEPASTTKQYWSPQPPQGSLTPPIAYPGAVVQKDTPVVVRMPPVIDPTTGQSVPGSALNGTYRYEAVGSDVLPAQRLIPWRIEKGSILLVDDGADQETVEVLSVDQTKGEFTAIFKRWHHEGFRIRMFGNPGPQPSFDYFNTKYRQVVLLTYGPLPAP